MNNIAINKNGRRSAINLKEVFAFINNPLTAKQKLKRKRAKAARKSRQINR